MEIPEHRRWMYNRLDHETRNLQSDFVWRVQDTLFVGKGSSWKDTRNMEAKECTIYQIQNSWSCPKETRLIQPPMKEEIYKRDVHIPEIIVKLNFDEKTLKWLSPYADNVIGKFNTMKEDAISRGEEVGDSALFLEACGGKNKRGKVFGMGSELCKYTKSAEVEEVDHLKKRLKSLESEVNLVHELVEENKQLKSEMAELRSLVRKLAGIKSGNFIIWPFSYTFY